MVEINWVSPAHDFVGSSELPEVPPRVPTLWVVPPGGLEYSGFPFGEVLRLEEGS